MKNLKKLLIASLIVIGLGAVFAGCNPNISSKYEMTIKISSASGTTVLYANNADVRLDSSCVKWNLYDSKGKIISEANGSIFYKEDFNAFYLQYNEFDLSFNTNLTAYYHLSTEHPCTQLEIDGTVYVSYD